MPYLEAPQYTWVCQYCRLSSPGGTLNCVTCGFPAHTSAFELERAKRSGSVQEFLKERDLQRHDWRRKPLPKKGTHRCDPAAVHYGRRSVASCIELDQHGAGRSNNGGISAAPLARQLK